MNKFLGDFDNVNDVENNFGVNLEGKNILFAEYNTESYEGSAWVIYYDSGKLYEVHGSHCSCDGLEGQWNPEDITAEVIIERINRGGHSRFSTDTVKEILNSSLNLFFNLDNLPNPIELKKILGLDQLIKDKSFLEDQGKQIKTIQQDIIETIKDSIIQNIENFSFSTKINMSSEAKSLMEYHKKDIHKQVNELFKKTQETLKNKGYHNDFILNDNINELKCEFKVQLNNTTKTKKVHLK